MKVVAFLPAKETSERIKNKNVTVLDGKPLFLHTLEKLMECDFIDEVYLDTESDDIYEMAKYTGCIYLKRAVELASNKTDGHSLFYNEAVKVDADIYVQILGTSPFIKKDTIKRAINVLKETSEFDSVVLVKKDKQYLWDGSNPLYNRENIPNSKDLPDTIIETMGLYVTNKHVALDMKRRYGSSPYLLEAEPIEAVDVNYPADFRLAEIIMKGLHQNEINQLNFMAKNVNSAMLSDILDDLQIDGVVNGLKCNMDNKKVFGRAKTLKLRKLNEGEDFRGIYDALVSYEQVTTNDIIVVENECGEFAYFGELNAMLAMRAGASATIVGGVTRDQDATRKFEYPVFAAGYNCKDVRKRATLESINQTIKLGGVSVSPNDLIFADNDGIVVIPFLKVAQVMEILVKKVSMEKNVASEIISYTNPLEIVNNVGEF